jgi:hypothetical protein
MKTLNLLREAGVFEDDRSELVLTAGFKHELMKRQCQNAIYKGSDQAVTLWAINTWIKPFEMLGDLKLTDDEKVMMGLVLNEYLDMTHPLYLYPLWDN